MPQAPDTPRPPTLTIVDHPLVQHKLSLMRKRDTSTSKFRLLMREISLLLAYEATRDLALEETEIETPLEPARVPVLAGKKVCLVSILRAGNGILDGMLDLVPSADVAHIGLYRDPESLVAVGMGDSNSLLHRTLAKITGFLYRRSDRIVVVTSAFEEHLVEHWSVPREKISVIENGLHIDYAGIDTRHQRTRGRHLEQGMNGRSEVLRQRRSYDGRRGSLDSRDFRIQSGF